MKMEVGTCEFKLVNCGVQNLEFWSYTDCVAGDRTLNFAFSYDLHDQI